MLARQNGIDTANVPAPTCNNQLIIVINVPNVIQRSFGVLVLAKTELTSP